VAKSGAEIYNPVQQDRLVYRKTAQDTEGELLCIDLFVSPRGGNPLHVHPLQEERFEAVSGTLGVQVGEERRWLREGEVALVPPGTPHRWWNESEEEDARVSVELRPALNSETISRPSTGSPKTARPAKTAHPTSFNKRSHSMASTRANSTSPGRPCRCRRHSWRPSPR
jgi:quercetin dioxygenase-like cupin family protein